MRCSELFDRTYIGKDFSIFSHFAPELDSIYDMITIDSATVTSEYYICIVVFTRLLDLRDQSKCQPCCPSVPDTSDSR